MYTYNIFAYLYFKSTKFYLLPTLMLVLSRLRFLIFLRVFSFSSFFFLFSMFLASTRRTRESTRFTRQFRNRSRFFSNPFAVFFFRFHYPLLFDISLSV